MSYTVSSAYHTAIKDGISEQDFFIRDMEATLNFLSSREGDFVAGSPTVSRSVCESQNFTMGECPANALSFTLSNPDGDGNKFWSQRGNALLGTTVKVKAGIGVAIYRSISENDGTRLTVDLFSSETLDMEVVGDTLVLLNANTTGISGDALQVNSEKVTFSTNTMKFGAGAVRVVVSETGSIMVYKGNDGWGVIDTGSSYISVHAVYTSASSAIVYMCQPDGTIKYMTLTPSVSSMPTINTLTGTDIPGAMVGKFKTVKETVVYGLDGFPIRSREYRDGVCLDCVWEYCPVGVYYIEPPKFNLYSAYIDVVDALDAMSKLDTSLTELASVNSFTLDASADAIINNICTALSIPLRSSYSLSPYTVTVTADMISADITCRQFFKWVGERAGHMWKVDPEGYLITYTPAAFQGVNVDYTLDNDYLVSGFNIYNEYVDPPQKLVVYYGDDLTYTSEASGNARTDFYKITGNPLYQDPSMESPEKPWLAYSDIPIRQYQLSDCMTVAADPSYGYGDAMYVSSEDDYKTYIMLETITFGIRAMAHYQATGTDVRRDATATTYTGVHASAEIPVVVGETVTDLDLATNDSVDNKINQTLQDALAAGGDIQSQIAQAVEGLISASDVNTQLDAIRGSIVDANTIKSWIDQAVNNYKNELQQFLIWSETDGLSIKAVDENGLQAPTFLNLLNDRLAFMYNGTIPAWMTANTFNINNLIVNESASIVGLIFQEVMVGSVKHLRLS